jgi:hypothetical protein
MAKRRLDWLVKDEYLRAWPGPSEDFYAEGQILLRILAD